MRLAAITGLLAAGSVQAFSDASPFLLFSTAEFPSRYEAASQLQTRSQVVSTAKDILASCPTSKYLLVSQPNVHASDIHGPPGCEAPRLRRALTSDVVRGRFSVAEVIAAPAKAAAAGDAEESLSYSVFPEHIKASCLAKGVVDPVFQHLQLPALPKAHSCHERSDAMGDNDYILGNAVDDVLLEGDHTVIYYATAQDVYGTYDAAFDAAQVPVQKPAAAAVADATARAMKRQALASNFTFDESAPLFQKYQFFTPGIFMGLLALFVLLSILYVGLSALASLQVSYGAFDKEMGPAAQKKQG